MRRPARCTTSNGQWSVAALNLAVYCLVSVSVVELSAVGFRLLALEVSSLEVHLPTGTGCEWTTVGDVPGAPGLYAFTVQDGHDLRVVYVGLTSHLWMVTNGHLPGGAGARGGQRYGRPKHAGVARQRVNVLIAETAPRRSTGVPLGSPSTKGDVSWRRRAANRSLGPPPRRLESRLSSCDLRRSRRPRGHYAGRCARHLDSSARRRCGRSMIDRSPV